MIPQPPYPAPRLRTTVPTPSTGRHSWNLLDSLKGQIAVNGANVSGSPRLRLKLNSPIIQSRLRPTFQSDIQKRKASGLRPRFGTRGGQNRDIRSGPAPRLVPQEKVSHRLPNGRPHRIARRLVDMPCSVTMYPNPLVNPSRRECPRSKPLVD